MSRETSPDKDSIATSLLICSLQCVIVDARADRLFETDLLKQGKNYHRKLSSRMKQN